MPIGTAKGAKPVLHQLAQGHRQSKPPGVTQPGTQLEFQSTVWVVFPNHRRHPGRLERLAIRRGLPPATIGAAYVDEGTRMDLHPGVEFRSTPAGRTAFVRGTRLQVWMALDAIRDFGGVEKAARALRIPALLLAGAKNYGQEFSEEMAACREAGRRPLEDIARLVPNHCFLP